MKARLMLELAGCYLRSAWCVLADHDLRIVGDGSPLTDLFGRPLFALGVCNRCSRVVQLNKAAVDQIRRKEAAQ